MPKPATASIDPVQQLLARVGAGRLPAPDGTVDVHPQPPGRSAAVLGFTAHSVIAADVEVGWVRNRLEVGDLGGPMRASFLCALAERLGRPVGALDVSLLAPGLPGRPALELVPLAGDHPRVARARRYRSNVRAYQVSSGSGVGGGRGSSVGGGGVGVVLVGRGFVERWETAFEVAPGDRGHGLGRALAVAARHLVPTGEPVWAQVSPGNAASLRAVLAAGYLPIGSEVLFLDDDGGSGDGGSGGSPPVHADPAR